MSTSVWQGGGRGWIASPEPERIQESKAQQKRLEWADSGSLRPSLVHACSSELELAAFLGLPTESSVHPIGGAVPGRRRRDGDSSSIPGDTGAMPSPQPGLVALMQPDLDLNMMTNLQDAGRPEDKREPARRRPGEQQAETH